ncbi:MAG: flagellar biosynthetic protein FliO [Bauldia sp.]|nr:flagellar biosynthetic protein FliO [Bauldia sp.]
MSLLQSITGIESTGVTLTLIVIGLAVALVLLFWIFRKIAGDRDVKHRQGHRPRLSVTDAAIIDEKRRLVLVRRDNVEHLVMIGGPTDIVIEQHIHRAAHHHGEDTHHGGQHREEHAAHHASAEIAPAREAEHKHAGAAAHEAPLQPSASVKPAQQTGARTEPASRPAKTSEPVRELLAASTSGQQQERAPQKSQPAGGDARNGTNALDDLDKELTDGLEAAFSRENAAVTAEAPARAPAVAAERPVATRPAPAPQVPAKPGARGENMEEEMQRLLSELSGSKPN